MAGGGARSAAPERDLQQRYAGWRGEAIRAGADPQSPDFLNFHEGSQPLVDCGFLAQALLRAPERIVEEARRRHAEEPGGGPVSPRVITPG